MKRISAIFIMISFALGVQGQEKQYLVKFFLLEDCVICQSYSSVINELHQTYGDMAQFVGYFPNFSSKSDKIEDFKNKYGLKFDLKTDYFKSQTKKYGIEVTPEVVVIERKTDKVLYKGRIDNEFYDIGKRRRVVTENDLEKALDALRKGKEIANSHTTAIGCFINFNDIN